MKNAFGVLMGGHKSPRGKKLERYCPTKPIM